MTTLPIIFQQVFSAGKRAKTNAQPQVFRGSLQSCRAAILLIMLLAPTVAKAQWEVQTAPTTADLRGISNVGKGIAWASGTEGTVLRTTNEGTNWQRCTTPPGAEHLDFRGIQAFNASTAIVMSSGKGDLSRLYKTTDACQTWTRIFANPDAPDGFFDAVLFVDQQHGILFGDPSPTDFSTQYAGDFRIRVTADGGLTWGPVSAPDSPHPGNGLHSVEAESAFAASNSAIASREGWFWFATSASRVASRRIFSAAPENHQSLFKSMYCAGQLDPVSGECGQPWIDFRNATVPVNHSSASAGIFSLYFQNAVLGVAVGGDYLKPDNSTGTAASTKDGGITWQAANTSPHGYRSAVAYDETSKTWITVGPNGTDISTDDGRNWRSLRPNPGLPEPADKTPEDRRWNALSLPFVVGPHGRIGKLRPTALTPDPQGAKP